MTSTERNGLVALLGLLAAAGGLLRWRARKQAALGAGAPPGTLPGGSPPSSNPPGGVGDYPPRTEQPDMGDDPTLVDVTDRRRRRPVGELTVSLVGVNAIKRHEAFRANLYNDQAGHATIGYGHLVHRGPVNGSEPAGFKAGITEPEAVDLLRQDLTETTRAIRRAVVVPLNQDEFDALTSLVFNIGAGNLTAGGAGGGPSTVLRKLNAGDYAGAAAAFAAWNKVTVGGQKVPSNGLIARRAAETALWNGSAVA